MKKVSFTDVEEMKMKVEVVKSLMVALEYGIFLSYEHTDTFRDGFTHLIDYVRDIEDGLNEIMKKMISEEKIIA